MNKVFIALLAGLLCLAGEANAQAGDKTAVCTACHGADGNSLAPSFPKLAGQHQRYLLKQLVDIKSGDRSIPQMTGMLDAFDEADLAEIAGFYAGQTPSRGVAKAELAELGESIYRAGNRDKGVAACTACHSPTGSGNGPAGYPMLSGQHADYTAATLRAFRIGDRHNDGDTRMMRDVAYRLSDQEIDAVASYIAGLH